MIEHYKVKHLKFIFIKFIKKIKTYLLISEKQKLEDISIYYDSQESYFYILLLLTRKKIMNLL
jgi:hypothetical protein